MQPITEVYKKYNVTEHLQMHQLQVAAVAQQICSNLTVPVDTKTVIQACLIHDMGNILKFVPAGVPAEWFAPQGVDYWMRVKQETIQKYKTTDEHKLNQIIAQELGLNSEVIKCIESIDFRKTLETLNAPEIEPKICDYADLRISPQGVVSLTERLQEGNRRYKNRPGKWLPEDERRAIIQACYDKETQVFSASKIKPSDITAKSIAPIVEQLKTYEI